MSHSDKIIRTNIQENKNSQREEHDIEKDVFLQQDDLSPTKNKRVYLNTDCCWQTVRRSVIVLFILQALAYVLMGVPVWRLAVERVIDPLLLLVDLSVFGWVASEAKLKYNQRATAAILVSFRVGLFLGLLVALFKFFWIREYWTVLNLVIEPVYTGLLAVVVGSIAFILTKKDKN